MLKGDCNNCLHGNEPEDSKVCVECGIARKNYTPTMAEYISRDLALSFPFANGEYDHKNANEHFINGCETYKEWLEGLPTADVAPIVRCKDCKHSYEDISGRCCAYGAYVDCTTPDDFYCAYGAKMDEGDGE